MPTRAASSCRVTGCPEPAARKGFCRQHRQRNLEDEDIKRGTAQQRGYTHDWAMTSKAFLSQPGNEFCRDPFGTHGARKVWAECTDHIRPPAGPDDPLFWEPSNWQPLCLSCNSIKSSNVV